MFSIGLGGECNVNRLALYLAEIVILIAPQTSDALRGDQAALITQNHIIPAEYIPGIEGNNPQQDYIAR